MTLSEWMNDQKIKDAEAADMFGVHRAHLSKVRRGVARPSSDLMFKIYEVTKGKVHFTSWRKTENEAA